MRDVETSSRYPAIVPAVVEAVQPAVNDVPIELAVREVGGVGDPITVIVPVVVLLFPAQLLPYTDTVYELPGVADSVTVTELPDVEPLAVTPVGRLHV